MNRRLSAVLAVLALVGASLLVVLTPGAAQAATPCRAFVAANKQSSGDILFTWTMYCNDNRVHDMRIGPVVVRPSGSTKYWAATLCYDVATECRARHRLPDTAGRGKWWVTFDTDVNGTHVGAGGAVEYHCRAGGGISCEGRNFYI